MVLYRGTSMRVTEDFVYFRFTFSDVCPIFLHIGHIADECAIVEHVIVLRTKIINDYYTYRNDDDKENQKQL